MAWLLVRLRLLVVPAWVAAAYLATAHLPSFADRPASTIGGLVPTNSGSTRVERRAVADFGTPLISRVSIVQRNAAGLSAAAQRRALRRAVRIDRGLDPPMRSIAFALPVSNAGRVFPSSRERGTTVVTFLYYRPAASVGAQLALAQTYEQRIRRAGDPVTGVTGTIPAREAEFHEINRTLPTLELATIGLIALILLVAFRSIGAPIITLGAAALSYLISVRLLTWFGDRLHVEVPREIQPVLVALLLGLTTDYAVFFLAGVRRRLERGEQRVDAMTETATLVMPIVVLAGAVVTLGSASLVVGRLGFFRAFGPGMAVTVFVTLAVTVTFVPALLAIFGRAVFWPGLRRRDDVDEAPAGPSALTRFTTRGAVAVVLAVVAAGALGLAASETRFTALGLTLIRGLPASNEVKRAAQDAGRGFAPGIVGPTEMLVEGRSLNAQRDSLVRLQALLRKQRGVAGVVGIGNQPKEIHRPLFVNVSGTAARFAVVFREDALSTHAIHALSSIEDRMPALLAQAGLHGARIGFAGDTALADDAVRSIHGDIARIAVALLVVNFVLLALFLRALLAPLFLLGASVLALGAAIGITTWIFQKHFGHQDITYYVPFAASVLLLSLGSDYNIFITGRIWQEAEQRPFREAIRRAAPAASRTIAIAGLTLAGSFGLLALIPIRPMRELAVVMAVGVLVDSFVVRSILVPSLIAAFGTRSWWPNRPPEVQPAAGEAD